MLLTRRTAPHGRRHARQHDSLQRLLALPDDLELYPAHFAGSSCGRAMSGKPSSTLGFERRFNPALQQRTPDEFVAFMLADLPTPPLGHREIRAANRLGTHSAPSSPHETAEIAFPHRR
jgi:hypothetical protein